MRRLAPLLALAALACSEEPRSLRVVFPEAAGLKPGDNVTIRGLSVGQVADVDLHPEGVIARLEIGPRFVEHVDSGARFRIETEKLVTGKMAVVIVPGRPPGEPLPPGAEVHGEPPEADPIDKAKAALTESIDHARDQAQGLGRAMLNPDNQPPVATGGTIDLDRPGRYRLRLRAVRVEPTTADGSDWDTGSAPDLVLQGWIGDRQILLTPAAEDTLAIEWPGDEALSAPFDMGGETLRVKVLDADVSYNDPIGVVELRPTPADARSKRRFRLAAGRVAELALNLEETPPPAPPAPAKPEPPKPAPGGPAILD